jgi:hypothetical protein
MKRAIDLGPVEAAAIKTAGGKIRLRLLLTADQLESMLIAARSDDPDDDVRSVTQCDAPEKTQTREDLDDEDDARARPQPLPPTAPVGKPGEKFVYQGTRAWDAWVAAGHPPTLAVRREHEGRVRTGWSFPSLFPPTDAKRPSEVA